MSCGAPSRTKLFNPRACAPKDGRLLPATACRPTCLPACHKPPACPALPAVLVLTELVPLPVAVLPYRCRRMKPAPLKLYQLTDAAASLFYIVSEFVIFGKTLRILSHNPKARASNILPSRISDAA